MDQCDGEFNMTEAEAIASLGKGPDDEYAAFTAASASKSQDNGVGIATAAGIPVCASIKQALQIGDGSRLNVDGVVLIGEHGDYPADEFGRHMYPRKHLFEQIAGVFAASGRSVPVFNDKHFSYNMEDGALRRLVVATLSKHCTGMLQSSSRLCDGRAGLWMWNRAKELDIPLFAGSSLVVCYRTRATSSTYC
jgi:hypothetical protein